MGFVASFRSIKKSDKQFEKSKSRAQGASRSVGMHSQLTESVCVCVCVSMISLDVCMLERKSGHRCKCVLWCLHAFLCVYLQSIHMYPSVSVCALIIPEVQQMTLKPENNLSGVSDLAESHRSSSKFLFFP